MSKTRTKRSGFSLAETVIALAVVAVVTVAALTAVTSAISARVKTENKSEAQSFAENALECFKASEDGDEFIDNMKFLGIGEDSLEKQSDGKTYVYKSNKFNAKITLDFNNGKFFIDVSEPQKGEKIVSFEYVRYTGEGGT